MDVITSGRPCETCRNSSRAAIDEALLSGQSISQISRHFTISEDSVRRHLRRHLSPAALAAVRITEPVPASTLVERVSEIAGAARAARERLLEAGNVMHSVRAGDAEIRALGFLADRLGIDRDKVAQDAAKGRAIALALVAAVHQAPELGELVAQALDAASHSEIADQVRAEFPETRKALSA